jgi:hypothetical protein
MTTNEMTIGRKEYKKGHASLTPNKLKQRQEEEEEIKVGYKETYIHTTHT